MPISDDAAAIAAAILTQAHAASVGGRASTMRPEQRVQALQWAYDQYLGVVRNESFKHEGPAPL